jgi:hypothetical protein
LHSLICFVFCEESTRIKIWIKKIIALFVSLSDSLGYFPGSFYFSFLRQPLKDRLSI